MTKEETIKKLKCIKKKCKYFDKDGVYTFCLAVFTENCCSNKESKRINYDRIIRKNKRSRRNS